MKYIFLLIYCHVLYVVIAETLEAVTKPNNIADLYGSSLKERLLLKPPQFALINCSTTSTSQIKVYLGWGGISLNIPAKNVETLGCSPIYTLSTHWWNAETAYQYTPIERYA